MEADTLSVAGNMCALNWLSAHQLPALLESALCVSSGDKVMSCSKRSKSRSPMHRANPGLDALFSSGPCYMPQLCKGLEGPPLRESSLASAEWHV